MDGQAISAEKAAGIGADPAPTDGPGPRHGSGTPVPRLDLAGIVHRYERDTVLDGVDLDVAPGEIVCLVGPSGCGKTTLLRIAAGVETQTAGRVAVDGEVMADAATFVPAERRALGFVFQDYALFPHLRILANVTYGLTGMPRREAETIARAALAKVGLAGYERAYPHALSGGEQQRTALVRALLPEPRAVLLDEPFSGLDRRLREKVREDTARVLRERGATALVVTHDPEEALAIADRIAVMEAGRIVQIDDPRTLYSHPASIYAAALFSELNRLPLPVTGGTVATPFGPLRAPGLADGVIATVAFRPDDLHIAGAGTPGAMGAHVVDSRFFGASTRLSLAIDGIDAQVVAIVGGDAEVAAGSEVFVAARTERFFVFGPDGRSVVASDAARRPG